MLLPKERPRRAGLDWEVAGTGAADAPFPRGFVGLTPRRAAEPQPGPTEHRRTGRTESEPDSHLGSGRRPIGLPAGGVPGPHGRPAQRPPHGAPAVPDHDRVRRDPPPARLRRSSRRSGSRVRCVHRSDHRLDFRRRPGYRSRNPELPGAPVTRRWRRMLRVAAGLRPPLRPVSGGSRSPDRTSGCPDCLLRNGRTAPV